MNQNQTKATPFVVSVEHFDPVLAGKWADTVHELLCMCDGQQRLKVVRADLQKTTSSLWMGLSISKTLVHTYMKFIEEAIAVRDELVNAQAADILVVPNWQWSVVLNDVSYPSRLGEVRVQKPDYTIWLGTANADENLPYTQQEPGSYSPQEMAHQRTIYNSMQYCPVPKGDPLWREIISPVESGSDLTTGYLRIGDSALPLRDVYVGPSCVMSAHQDLENSRLLYDIKVLYTKAVAHQKKAP